MRGVYHIANTENGNGYIGSSVNVKKRWDYHRSCLRNNKHDNSHLQRAWNKYGEESFLFSVLWHGKCSEIALRIIETMYIHNVASQYNIARIATRCHMYGKTHSVETRKKISEAVRGKNPWAGKSLSEEHKRKIRENHADFSGKNNPCYGKTGSLNHMFGKRGEDNPNSKITQVEANEIRRLYATGKVYQKALAKMFCLSQQAISNIILGKTYPDEES